MGWGWEVGGQTDRQTDRQKREWKESEARAVMRQPTLLAFTLLFYRNIETSEKKIFKFSFWREAESRMILYLCK